MTDQAESETEAVRDSHLQLVDRILTWYSAHQRDLPWRRDGFTPWGQLVAEMMLQQTQVDRVVPKLHSWLERWPTPADLAADSPAEAIRMWDRLGYPRRALWLHRAAQEIVARFNGEVPSDVDDLLSLTGVGDYTARAIAVFAFGHRHPVVDTNTRRVLARAILGLSEAPAPSTARDLQLMESVLPIDIAESAAFNAGVMELGAIVCTAKKPLCDECPFSEHCLWAVDGWPENVPAQRRVKQARFEGSDRQARGKLMAHLREHGTASTETLLALVTDGEQAQRALDSLARDGLIVRLATDWSLPTRSRANAIIEEVTPDGGI